MTKPQQRSEARHSIISLNGEIVLPSDLPLSPLDRGFTLGDGIFETMKVTNGVVWYVDRHLNRLSLGAAKLGIVVPAKLRQWIDQLVRKMESLDSYGLRVTLTRGIAETHGLAGNVSRPTIALTTFDLPERPNLSDEAGLHAVIAAIRRYELGSTVGIKTTNYLESVLALREAVAAGYDEVIFLDTRGFVSEASSSNIFLQLDGRLVTPSNTCGILPGVTRAVTLELAERAGIPVEEREIPGDDIYRAAEIFLTSSLREIVPVTQLSGRLIGTGTAGPITRQLIECYGAVLQRI